MEGSIDYMFVLQHQRPAIGSSSSKSIVVLIFLMSLSWYLQLVGGEWSIAAWERQKAREIRNSLNATKKAEELRKMSKVAVFYGSRKERLQNRVCEKLRCDFINNGCVYMENNTFPFFKCFTIWAELSRPPAGDCPYAPCEGYNRKSTCVTDEQACAQGQGNLIPFGICNDYKKCCMFRENG